VLFPRRSNQGQAATLDGWSPVDKNGAANDAREWLLAGSDELFRGIYARCSIKPSESITITSAISGEGKTTLALGLATTVAQDFPERRVLLVEADLERPVLADDFGVAPSPGLTEYLLSGVGLQSAFRTTHLPNLHLVPAGERGLGVGRMVRSGEMAMALDVMKRTYDLVILDGPALLVNSDALALTDLADGTIFVVRAGVTPMSMVDRAIEQVDDGRLRGVVLNGEQSSIPGWLRRLFGL
jgi:Mrp family chromosome partitioning ATPase